MEYHRQQAADALKVTNSNKRPDQSINCDANTGRGAKLRGPDLIGAIDQGTSSTRFLVFENHTGHLIASSQIEIKRITPKEGWVEMDPNAIMSSVYATMANVYDQLNAQQQHNQHRQQHNQHQQPDVIESYSNLEQANVINMLKCIGICNQRESTVVWDSQTGQPLYNVIVWMDNRTKDLVDNMIDSVPGRDLNRLKDKTGLPMSTYFSAFKLKWLIDNVPQVRKALDEKRLLFGTVDTWILWNLAGKHLTDVTNASRTFLMDIETLNWDKSLCKQFKIPIDILPKIRSSADDFGQLQFGPFKGTPITGVIGDQSAALFGHNCLQLGQTKATFGTGCFIMQNIGPGPLNGALSGVSREAKRGLVTTVGYKLGDRPACYALEGSIKIAGAALTWLRDNLQLISNYEECDQLVNETTNSAGVYFVPALGGLYSPYWDPNAAGLFIGLSQFTKREHLARATFDSISFQTNDILSLMRGVANGLMIDGGLCKSDNLCQILADITGYDIVRPAMCETSALGAAMVAGHGAGIWSFESMLNSSANTTTSSTMHYPHESLNYEQKFSAIMQAKSFKSSQRATAAEHQQIQRQQSSSGRQRRARYTKPANLSNHRLHCNLDAGGGGGGGRVNAEDDAGGGLGNVKHQKPPSLATSNDNHADIQSSTDDNESYAAEELEDLEDGVSTSQLISSSTETDLNSVPRLQGHHQQHQSCNDTIVSDTISATMIADQQQKMMIEQHLPARLIAATNIHEHPLESSYESSEIDIQHEIMMNNEETMRRFYATTSSGYSSGDNFELATTNSTNSFRPSEAGGAHQSVRALDSPINLELLSGRQSATGTATTNAPSPIDNTTPIQQQEQQHLISTSIGKVTKARLQDRVGHQAPAFRVIQGSSDQFAHSDDSIDHQVVTSDDVHAFGGRDSYGEDGYDSSTQSSHFESEDGDDDDDDDDDNDAFGDVDEQPISLIEGCPRDGPLNTKSDSNINDINTMKHRRRMSSQVVPKQVDIFQPYISLEHRTDLVETWRRAVERSMQWTKVHHEEVRRIDYQRLSSLPISMYLFFSIGLVALSSVLGGHSSPLTAN